MCKQGLLATVPFFGCPQWLGLGQVKARSKHPIQFPTWSAEPQPLGPPPLSTMLYISKKVELEQSQDFKPRHFDMDVYIPSSILTDKPKPTIRSLLLGMILFWQCYSKMIVIGIWRKNYSLRTKGYVSWCSDLSYCWRNATNFRALIWILATQLLIKLPPNFLRRQQTIAQVFVSFYPRGRT